MSTTPHHPAEVDLGVRLRLVVPDAESVPLDVALRYRAADPYAVRAVFGGSDLEVEWVFARSLLSAGVDGPCGDGDVQVWPGLRTSSQAAAGTARTDGIGSLPGSSVAPVRRSGTVMLSLTSPDGHAVLEAEAGDVQRFLDATYDVVPQGEESDHVDVDAALNQLLS